MFINEENGHTYISRYCEDAGHPHSFPLYCGKRSCGFCRENKYLRLLNLYLRRIKKIKSYRLKQITLTFRNKPHLFGGDVAKGLKCFYRLRSNKFWKDNVVGSLAVIEDKHVSDLRGHNLHIHILVDAPYLPQKQLSKIWYGITGDSFIVDVRKEENSKNAVFHILKYLSKSPILQGGNVDELRAEYDNAFRNVRSVVSSGTLYAPPDEGLIPYQYACKFPGCGCKNWISEAKLRSMGENNDMSFLQRWLLNRKKLATPG